MEINKLLIEGYLVFGIILTYTIVFILGILIGDKQREEKEYQNYDKQIQSKKESAFYGTKFKIME